MTPPGDDGNAAMRVLMLTREYPPHVYGGAGVVVDHLSRALAGRAAVEVRCFGDNERSEHGLRVRGYPSWERLGERLGERLAGSPPAGAGDARYAQALEALSTDLLMARDRVDADVVHSHTWYVALAGLLVRTLFDIPLVVTLHSLEPLRPWKEEQLGAGYGLSRWAERAAVECADRVIAVSAQMREDVLAHFSVDAERVRIIHNGVDTVAFRRTERRDALDRHGVRPPYVLFVGRISEQKGIFHLLEAAADLPADTQLVLCASSPDTKELEARLGAAVAQRSGVRWLNAMLPREDVVQLYSHAALFVCPSVYEPFGLINLEAMACGIPVVATSVGGITEVVVHDETGWLVPPADPAALAAAMRALLGQPERAAAFGRAGRRRVEAQFSWERIAERTLEVYREAIAAHRSVSARYQPTLHAGSSAQPSGPSPSA